MQKVLASILLTITTCTVAQEQKVDLEVGDKPLKEVWNILKKKCPAATKEYQVINNDEPVTLKVEQVCCSDIVKLLIDFDQAK